MNVELTGKQRRHLRGLAHNLRPVVQVGQAGMTDAVLAAIDEALRDHELIKVRLNAPEDKKAQAQSVADALEAALCGVIGHTIILFRPDPEAPKITL